MWLVRLPSDDKHHRPACRLLPSELRATPPTMSMFANSAFIAVGRFAPPNMPEPLELE
jgi:hypothetical protein